MSEKQEKEPVAHYTVRGRCAVCDNEANLIGETGLCAACCFGEADALAEFEE